MLYLTWGIKLTNLDYLNKLLKRPVMGLPNHRNTVDRNGSNLFWLKKHVLPTSNDFAIVHLLSKNMNDLLKPLDEIFKEADQPSVDSDLNSTDNQLTV